MTLPDSQDLSILLICTVGGTAEPIVVSLKHWKPQRVHFVVSAQTSDSVEKDIIPLARTKGFPLDPGRYELLKIADPQDLGAALNSFRTLQPIVDQWLARGDNFQVVVDFTGGTKCMSAALALQARLWRCLFSYVGGTKRDKDGVGPVITGTERIVHAQNPWEALGFQAVEQFITLFDQGSFKSAAKLAEVTMKPIQDPTRKREFATLMNLAQAYEQWDRFDHTGALAKFKDLEKSSNDLKSLFGENQASVLLATLEAHRGLLQKSPQIQPTESFPYCGSGGQCPSSIRRRPCR